MLDGFERSAIAESQEGIDMLVANNASEQSPEQSVSSSSDVTSAQLLVGVVQHNLVNPENHITLSLEQGNEIRQDFDAFLAESSDTPTTEDGTPLTFNEMNDTQLEKCLSEYLGSGIANYSINGALIEGAQEIMAEQYMSDEELEDLPNPKTAKGQEARQRKIIDRMRDAADELDKQGKWEKDVWSNQTYDVGNLKLTGKQIDAILDDLADSKKREKLAEDYKNKYGGTTAEADQVLTDTEKYLKAKKRYEYLKASNQLDKMTPEEKANLELIKTNPKIEKAVELIEERTSKNENVYGANISKEQFQKGSVDQQVSLINEDAGVRKAFRIGTSAVNEYQVDDKPSIKTGVSPQAEFNTLGNPATAEVATANMNNRKAAPQIIVADNKVASASVDMM